MLIQVFRQKLLKSVNKLVKTLNLISLEVKMNNQDFHMEVTQKQVEMQIWRVLSMEVMFQI